MPGQHIITVNALCEVDEIFQPVANSEALDWQGIHLHRYRLSDDTGTPEISFQRHILTLTLCGSFKNDIRFSLNSRRTTQLFQSEALFYPAGLVNRGYEPKNADIMEFYLQKG